MVKNLIFVTPVITRVTIQLLVLGFNFTLLEQERQELLAVSTAMVLFTAPTATPVV
jgi:hypothetical protein